MWIKVCGIRDVNIARVAALAGADAVGLNFHPPSPRFVDEQTASQIVAALPSHVESIGVFVNRTADDVVRIAETVGLTGVQLHGDETPDLVAEIAHRVGPRFVIRAFRVDETGLDDVAREMDALRSLQVELFAALVDARVAGTYGGSGVKAPWHVLRRDWQCEWPPLVLAGGLTPENVADAVAEVGPWGVDVAGGVESSPGVKDAARIQTFLERARA
ncbi:MAG: phosphoribosylanthranilate isomerase [Planctomycetaceae bacterium]|nr:phosphoribosylanthranilate isomerase [Planctomycetaceae bacterium]